MPEGHHTYHDDDYLMGSVGQKKGDPSLFRVTLGSGWGTTRFQLETKAFYIVKKTWFTHGSRWAAVVRQGYWRGRGTPRPRSAGWGQNRTVFPCLEGSAFQPYTSVLTWTGQSSLKWINAIDDFDDDNDDNDDDDNDDNYWWWWLLIITMINADGDVQWWW